MINNDHRLCFKLLLPCQPRMTVTSHFVYKVIRDLESIDHLFINPIHRIGLIYTSDLSICVSSSEVYTLVFYLAIVNTVLYHGHFWLARQYNYASSVTLLWFQSTTMESLIQPVHLCYLISAFVICPIESIIT